MAPDQLLHRLRKTLERFRDRCGATELAGLTRSLRRFADEVDGARKRRRSAAEA